MDTVFCAVSAVGATIGRPKRCNSRALSNKQSCTKP